MEQKCHSCSAALRAGSRFCVKCGQPIQNTPVLPPLPAPQQLPLLLDQIVLHITMRPTRLAYSNFDFRLDDLPIGHGSFKEGVDLRAPVKAGKHILALTAKIPLSSVTHKLSFNVAGSRGEIPIEIKYDLVVVRFWLRFQ